MSDWNFFTDKAFNVDYRADMIAKSKAEHNALLQWATPFNLQLKQIILDCFVDIPGLGYQYIDYFETQDQEIAKQVLYRLYGIKQTFGSIVLSDEEYSRILSYMISLSLAKSFTTIYNAMANALKNTYWILEDGKLYILSQEKLDVWRALVKFKLLYYTFGTNINLVLIPDDIDLTKNKIWWIPHSDNIIYGDKNMFYPNNTSPLTDDNIPIKIQPEWVYFIY